MFKAQLGSKTYEIEKDTAGIKLNGKLLDWDVSPLGQNKYHIISNNRSFNLEVLSIAHDTKTLQLKINGKTAEVQLKDKLDLLLEKLGMDVAASSKVNDIKAPMPGLILEINVNEGDEVAKGDQIMILEAMKMENVLKSPGDGIVKAIKVKKGDSVEKNQVLIQF